MERVRKCYVCKEYVKVSKAQYIGNDLYRHTGCYPGSIKWLKSDIGKKSPLYEIFKIGKEIKDE